MKKVIFGAGAQGRTAASAYRDDGVSIDYFVDNNPALHGKSVIGIPVIGMDGLISMREDCEVIICCDISRHQEMIRQLAENGISNYSIFDKETILRKERIVSYSYASENEDIILYHVLKDRESIFWIDIGSNDPSLGSVTKLFYDRGHSGINVDMEPGLIEITRAQRPRDISLCVGVGDKEGTGLFYHQGEFGGLSTMVKENSIGDHSQVRETKITTLKNLCEKYVKDREITFLKIDVEGKERDVLAGADFEKFRPEILIVESTLPNTDIYNYENWENIVLENNYQLAYVHGVNRYYVAEEKKAISRRFIPWNELAGKYCIMQAELAYYC